MSEKYLSVNEMLVKISTVKLNLGGDTLQIESTRNTIRGIFYGVINKAVMIIMPFIIRSILIHNIGTEYAGLSSLFTSILRVMNMAELGFASAATYSLYKPIAEKDAEKICALLSFYRKIYHTIGTVIMIVGLALMPFLDKLIKGSYPADVNLRTLYLIYLIDSAASYFLFSYKNLILNAYQRVDIISNISTVLHLMIYVWQIIALVVFKSYYAYVVSLVVLTVANNLVVAKYVSKQFPQYFCKDGLTKGEKKDIVKNSYGMLLFRICQVTRNSLDTVFISAFIGLTTAAIYNNYYQVFAGLVSIQTIIRESMRGGIGNKIALNSPEKNHADMLVFMYLYAWLSGVFTASMLCLYQPFMQLWVGTKLMLDEPTMIMFCVYFYISSMGSIRFLYHQSAGLFWTKRYWTVAETLVNVIGNFVLVKLCGTFGVICSTVISLITIDFFYSSTIVYDYYFKNGKIGIFFKKHGIYLLTTFVSCASAYLICKLISVDGLLGLFLKLVVCLIVSNTIFWGAYRMLPEYSAAKKIVRRVVDMAKKKVKIR